MKTDCPICETTVPFKNQLVKVEIIFINNDKDTGLYFDRTESRARAKILICSGCARKYGIGGKIDGVFFR